MESKNEKKLISKLKESFLSGELSSSSLLHKLPSLANVYRFGIVDYLQREFPALTSEEIEFCSAIAIGLSPYTLSKAFGYDHPGTLYNKRTRIRRKITDLQSDMPLEVFIERKSSLLKSEHEKKIYENLEKMNLDVLFTEK